jgi:hypothetical protein
MLRGCRTTSLSTLRFMSGQRGAFSTTR